MFQQQHLEIGGENKSFKQIKDIENSFVVADDIEIGCLDFCISYYI